MASAGFISPPWVGGLTEDQLEQVIADTIAEIGNATTGTPGLMSDTDKLKLDGLDEGDYVKYTTLGSDKYVDITEAPAPSSTGTKAVLFLDPVTGLLTAQKGGVSARTGLAPANNSIPAVIDSNQTITGTNVIDLGVFPMLPLKRYQLIGHLGYSCDAAVDFEIYFQDIPVGGVCQYFSFVGATVATSNAAQAAVSVDVSRKSGTDSLTLGGTAADEIGVVNAGFKIGATGGYVLLRGKKKNTGAAGNVTVLPSVLNMVCLGA